MSEGGTVHIGEVDSIPYFTPAFLHQGVDDGTEDNPELASEGARILLVLAYMLDAYRERVEQGVRARYPSLCAEDARDSALELQARNRGFIRGRSEPAARFAARLAAWREPFGHRVRGNAYALADQIFNYWGPTADGLSGASCEVIDVRGLALGLDGTGAITKRSVEWYWDITWNGSYYIFDADLNWARFWVTLYLGALAVERPDYPDWEEGGVIGMTGVTPQDIIAMRSLVYGRIAWRPAGTQPQWMIFSLDDSVPEVISADWVVWSERIGTTRRPTRYAGWRYVPYREEYSIYQPNPIWVDASEMPGGSTYTPTATWHAGPHTMHDGAEYTPTATWHTSAKLVHDGTPITS